MLSKDGIKADNNTFPPTLIITNKKLPSSKYKNHPPCMMPGAFMTLILIPINVSEHSPISSISSIKDNTLLLIKVLKSSLLSLNFCKVKMHHWEELFMLVSKKWRNSLLFMLSHHHFSKIFIIKILISEEILWELFLWLQMLPICLKSNVT